MYFQDQNKIEVNFIEETLIKGDFQKKNILMLFKKMIVEKPEERISFFELLTNLEEIKALKKIELIQAELSSSINPEKIEIEEKKYFLK